ncbi:APC family permease [Patulibacter sp. SYSU D01012]|uniref:APC family permease n=1 Tax=Patulibacter sp. SYSU D01012 TaxID=2817381 RepID=UPI001B3070BB|nr:APC family permease [Patulibacter sp. SYSU D01012]
MSTAPARAETDEDVGRFGYEQEVERTISPFGSFAMAFSFVSIATGIFTGYGLLLANSGPVGIWMWLLAGAGQTLVALVFIQLALRMPIAGYSYQWASRLVGPKVGWAFGWVSYAFLAIVIVAVTYGMADQSLIPLTGLDHTVENVRILTVIALALQAFLIIFSQRIVAVVNNIGVGIEIVGIFVLSILLVAAVLFGNDGGSVDNLFSKGTHAGESGYWGFNGPFMIALLLGAYTIVGFESAANLAEETKNPARVVPRAMLQGVLVSTGAGFLFLVALTLAIPNVAQITASDTPGAAIMTAHFGEVFTRITYAFISLAQFVCGLTIMTSGSRLVYAMSRDRRFPGHQVLGRVSPKTGTPIAATILILAGGIVLTLIFGEDALANLFSAATILPTTIYLITVLLYAFTKHRLPEVHSKWDLGRWTWPVIVGAVAWCLFALSALTLPEQFRDPVKLVGVVLGLGVVVFLGMLVFSPGALRRTVGERDPIHGGLAADEAGDPDAPVGHVPVGTVEPYPTRNG